VDRGTGATLGTYNTWVRLVVCKRFGHSQSMDITGSCAPFPAARIRLGAVRDYDAVRGTGRKQHCIPSMDSGLEAFSRNPADGSFAELTFQSTALTKDLNEVFLSY
jgi:hypothetical protein